MYYYKLIFLILQILNICKGEVNLEKNLKLLNGFIDFYNNLPNQIYTCEEGTLDYAEKVDENRYKIQVVLKVAEVKNSEITKHFKCVCTVQDLLDTGVTVLNNEYQCQEQSNEHNDEEGVTEEYKPVQLDNEVQSNTAVTSGEQFIAIPREEPAVPCVGCASHVNPQAAGVAELASLGIRHLDRHESNVKHSLKSVVDVERQVQVVNGVRYILTLLVDYNNCTDTLNELCQSTKPCKISILEKPWVRLSNGGKYRAILSNNCTDSWQFGDNGEILDEHSDSNKENNEIDVSSNNNNAGDDNINVVHTEEIQSLQSHEKSLTDDQIKNIEEQILPHKEIIQGDVVAKNQAVEISTTTPDNNKEHIIKDEAILNANSVGMKHKKERIPLSEDRKKAVDDLINFFNLYGFGSDQLYDRIPRVKRSYDRDLEALYLAEKYKMLQNTLNSGKHLYDLAQTVVDYLNEMDLEVKSRVLNEVLKAEEEIENYQHFFYIQARVIIPCEKIDCSSKDTVTKICNGVVDDTDNVRPRVVNAFCYSEQEDTELNKMKSIPVDDPVLLELAKEGSKKIEVESSKENAMLIKRVIGANTQIAAGRLTTFTIILNYLNCTKYLPLSLRRNCTILEELGSNVCEITIHERILLKQRKITYTCIERPIEGSFSHHTKRKIENIDDIEVIQMVQEALQYLEVQSNRNNKQKVISINSVSTELNAGLLTDIEFVVGYTQCTNDIEVDLNTCEILPNEPVRKCKAQIWDRTWIEDGRKIDVTCEDNSNAYNDSKLTKKKKKRSLNFVGGQEPQDVNDAQYKALAEESLLKFIQSSGSQKHYNIVQIIRASVQIVSGTIRRIEFTISPTDCVLNNDGQASSKICNIVNTSDIITCKSTIFEPIWHNNKEIEVSCETKDRKRRSLNIGVIKPMDPTDLKYKQLAVESFEKYLEISGYSQPNSVIRVENVSEQIVSGKITRLQFAVSSEHGSSDDSVKCYSVVWEQPWLKKKEIDVNCHIDNQEHRAKRQVPGGLKEQDPNDPRYRQLADESLQKYLQTSGNSKPHRVVQVDKVSTQVVSGTLTHIDFTITPTSDISGDTIKCHSKVWEQPWSNKKEIDVNCHIDNQEHRAKRQVPGGLKEQDPNDPRYRQLADESLQKYLQTSGNSKPHRVVQVDKVSTQVVSGTLTHIDFTITPTSDISGDTIKCHSKVWEQPWSNKKEIDVNCHIDNQEHRAKRQVPGGLKEQDPNDPRYRQLADESLQKYLQTFRNSKPHRVVQVDKVSTQVVSGTLTRIDFTITPTSDISGDTIKCHSKVWEQPWSNKKEIDVNCHIDNQEHRAKRQVSGGLKEQDPNDPRYRQLADESLQKYLQTSGNSKPHRVVQVDKVSTQVVSGTLTRIDFTITPTSDISGDTIKCQSKVWEQPWSNKKEIDVNCHIDNQEHRAKRQVPGGLKEQDPNDPRYRQLADESLQKYLQTSGNSKPHRVVQVDKVSTQVVSGTLTRIDFTITPTSDISGDTIKCQSKVWEQPWSNKKEIDVNCHIDNQEHRAKRQVPGGLKEQDPNDPRYRQLADESLQKYLQTSGNSKPHRVVQVDKVSTQVVSGTLTHIDFTITPTSDISGDTIKCHSKVWEQPWSNKKEIDVNCHIDNQEHRAKRQVPGGLKEQDPNDPRYRQLADESLQKYLQTSGNSKPHRVVQVDKVSTQVVSGTLTHIDFTITPTSDISGDTIKCHSKVWEQPWSNKKEIDVNCHIDNQEHRAKRQVPGGLKEQDPNDPRYRQLADESLQKYLQTFRNSKPHRVVQVDKVSTQVVSGTLTRIDFTITPTSDISGDTIKCHSKVWEQPWSNKKEIDVNCHIDNQEHRAKRQVSGGLKEQDPNDPRYRQLADESLQKYLQTSGNSKPHRVVQVDKVSTQVVSGTLTRIDFTITPTSDISGDTIKCQSKVWEQPWSNKKEIDVNCHIDNQEHRAKRQVPGGLKEQDPNDPRYRQLADESLQKYLQTSGNSKPHRVVQVDKVSTQVVSGTLTRIDFTITPTSDISGDTIKCHSKVWEQPWSNKKEIDVNCHIDNQEHRAKRQVSGGLKEQDPNDPRYRQLADESLQKYLQTSGNSKPHRVVQVDKVSTQVVSGTLTHIDFTITPTSDISGDTIKCHSKVWEQPWSKKKEIDVDCKVHQSQNRDKRYTIHRVGKNNVIQDPTKSEYRILAQESLKEYQRLKKSKFIHKVVDVKRVATRVVSGLMYDIDFSAVPTTCSGVLNNISRCKPRANSVLLYCNTNILSQPWKKTKKIKVSCNPSKKKLSPGNGDKARNKLDVRRKRQTKDDEDYIDEDLRYYYAERAMHQLNQESQTNNLYKLVTIHTTQNSVHMGANMIRMFIEIAPTFCLRHADENDLQNCEEMDGLNHKLCLARMWPSPDDELAIQSVNVVCDDDSNFASVTGLSITQLLKASLKQLESSHEQKYKLVHLGEPHLVPNLDPNVPTTLSFIVGFTNCTKDMHLEHNRYQCFMDEHKGTKPCTSFIWFVPNSREIYQISVNCREPGTRRKRSVPLTAENATADDMEIQKLVQQSLEKLEMASIHRYKQRVLLINSYSTKITTGKVTTIDFDVGYTSCLKYEWIDDVTTCEFLEHLPRRHCVSQIYERLWLQNGKNIEVHCEDDETPLEAHIEFESAEMALELAKESLKHIEAKYPHPRKQKVVRIFSLDKQVVAGIHYRMKIEVGFTNCTALSAQVSCKLIKDEGINRFCRVNVWLRPWTDHPPRYRVTCDYQETATADVYHHIQAEHLFYDFITTYGPDYMNDHNEMRRRFDIFKGNVKLIHEMNVHERGTARYGITRFADLTYDEFSTKYMGLKPSLKNHNEMPMRKAEIPKSDLPDKFDWRDFNTVTEVKDQGSCGSCWAFSVTGNIEGQWKLHTGALVSLSEQELVDCDKLDQGCNGGLPDNAYRAIEQLGGLEQENDYPYEGADDKCVFNKTLSKVQITGAVNISSNETDMAKWLVHNGPISIGINANAMQFYMGGISHPWRMLCNPSNLDHGVLIVGYGIKDYPLFHKRLPYWTIKNSWGKSWGEQGYYRVFRGDGTCGVNQMASSAVI